MNCEGTYKGYLCFMDGELYIGEKDGKDHIEFSIPAIGLMHSSTKDAVINGNEMRFIMEVNGLDGMISIKEENGKLDGEMYVKEVDMHFKVDMKKESDKYEFCEEYYIVSEENRNILRENCTYSNAPSTIKQTYDLGNEEVLKVSEELGIITDNNHDFATLLDLMNKTEQVIHQDGVNYVHTKEHGTLAQLNHAIKHNHHTNCRGISIIFSGILRAYGFNSSYVECFPSDPNSSEIHVVTEVYVPDFHKYVMFDISNRMVVFKDNIPLSIMELRNAISNGEDGILTSNENIRNPLNEVLAYLSKNLVVISKQVNNNEVDEIDENNSICLVPEELKSAFAKRKDLQFVSTNINDYYSVVE